jgi:hypothetical protein
MDRNLEKAFVTILSNKLYLGEDFEKSIALPEYIRGFSREVLVETARNWGVCEGHISESTSVVGVFL